jgi:copper(I)-binding protein
MSACTLRRLFTAVAFLAGALALPGVATASATVEVRDAVASPGESVAAAYLTIVGGSTEDTLEAVSTDIATAGLHETTTHDGHASMEHLHEVTIGAGREVRFARGGLHVMLEELARPLVPGDRFELRLAFRHAGEVAVPVTVVHDGELPQHAFVDGAGGAGNGSGSLPLVASALVITVAGAAAAVYARRRRTRVAGVQ